MRTALVLALTALSLAACDSSSDSGPATEVTADDTAAMEVEGVTPTPTPGVAETTEPTAIPATLRGRWGLTEADCEPGRSDAKGLLTISADKLEFYESVATLGEIEEASASRMRAGFNFTGEGMTWQRDITFDAQDGGQTLVRSEHGEGAPAGPFRYTKCP